MINSKSAWRRQKRKSRTRASIVYGPTVEAIRQFYDALSIAEFTYSGAVQKLEGDDRSLRGLTFTPFNADGTDTAEASLYVDLHLDKAQGLTFQDTELSKMLRWGDRNVTMELELTFEPPD